MVAGVPVRAAPKEGPNFMLLHIHMCTCTSAVLSPAKRDRDNNNTILATSDSLPHSPSSSSNRTLHTTAPYMIDPSASGSSPYTLPVFGAHDVEGPEALGDPVSLQAQEGQRELDGLGHVFLDVACHHPWRHVVNTEQSVDHTIGMPFRPPSHKHRDRKSVV